ncbi:hypothetical protein N510_000154 [Firmicutes bacterium ASF500]|nr:hypothetical protein N510_000154 [Firmicutes bacterium ASF500]
MKRLLICLLLAAALITSACALEVPTDITVQNLNGSQQLIKTYILPPGADPKQLIEEPFEQEGYRYTFSDIVKEENQVSDRKYHTETVTLSTKTKDLSKILEQLEATMDYTDGAYTGTLTLEPASIHTEASGYTSKSKSVTATKTIGPLDRNDMSYVPATTVKDGVTLNLSNVDWQVIGTDQVGDALALSSYQAVATYSGKSYTKAATGYTTSASYVGEVTRSDVESVTYRVTYLGSEAEAPGIIPDRTGADAAGLPGRVLPYALGVLGAGTVITLSVLLFRSRRALRRYQEEEDELEHEEGSR